MRKHQLRDINIRRTHLAGYPSQASSLAFDDLYQDISEHWEEKARRLQARRWRKIKNQLV